MRRWIVYFGIILLVALFILPSMSFAQGGSGIGTVYTTYKQRTTAAPTPASGYDRLYFKSDDKLYRVTSAGSEAEVGSGDVTGVGDCASGACLDGSSDGGTYIRLYDGDSHYTALYAGNSSANLSFYFPTAAGAQGGVLYFSAANQLAILAAATAGNPLISGGAAANPSFLSIVLAGGTNTFSITNGTASLDVAAGVTADINANFTVNTALSIGTGAVTLTGDAGGGSVLVLPNGSVTLPVAVFEAPGAAGGFLCSDGAGVWARCTTMSSSDSAAQFYSATASKGDWKMLMTSMGDGIHGTFTPVCTGDCVLTTETYGAGTYTLVDKTSTQTLTNKTLTTPVITSLEVLIDCNGSADPYTYCTSANASTLTATQTSRTIINSYGRGEAQTVTLPAAATGMTFIAMVGTQHNSAWKIQRAGSDTITWSASGTDTTGKTYFQETNQAVGSRVSCITYKTGEAAWTWLCGSVTGTWVTD